jgi:hypothetical protein
MPFDRGVHSGWGVAQPGAATWLIRSLCRLHKQSSSKNPRQKQQGRSESELIMKIILRLFCLMAPMRSCGKQLASLFAC